MIITWTGLGWLFLLIPCIILIICGFMTDIFGAAYITHFFMIGFILSSIICWFLGKKVNKEKIIAYDDQTGDPIIQKNIHTLWSMPVQYFSLVLLGFAIICFLVIIFA